MQAVILDRNKQYFVKEGVFLKIDKLDVNIGDNIEFDKILCFFDGNNSIIGDPFVNKKSVLSKVIQHFKNKKKLILKFKRRKGYLRHYGHKQDYTLIKIVSIKTKID